jgi:phosphoribosylglycinamide formyltransferase-1
VAVASDKVDAPALRRAQAAGIATEAFPRERFDDRSLRDAAMTAWLEARRAELVVLAGYMALLDAAFVRRWVGRLVNVHPSLLPAFPGVGAIEQALGYGVALFGVTVHLVDEGIDTGPILLQEAVTLPQARTPEEVHDALRPIEHRLLCAAVRAFAAGGVSPDPAHPRRWLVR